MAETTQFILEGNFSLAYFADERDSRHVLMYDEENPNSPNARLECKIAEELVFPNDQEFDEIFDTLHKMRSQGMRPKEGVPVKTRQTKLRITIEVIE